MSKSKSAAEKFLEAKEEANGGGVKFDGDKVRWDLLPIEEIEDVVKVLTVGSKKYEDNNWKNIENIQSRYFAAAMRHLVSHRTGESLDQETGLPHLSHAICCLLFMAWDDKQRQTIEIKEDPLTDLLERLKTTKPVEQPFITNPYNPYNPYNPFSWPHTPGDLPLNPQFNPNPIICGDETVLPVFSKVQDNVDEKEKVKQTV